MINNSLAAVAKVIAGLDDRKERKYEDRARKKTGDTVIGMMIHDIREPSLLSLHVSWVEQFGLHSDRIKSERT